MLFGNCYGSRKQTIEKIYNGIKANLSRNRYPRAYAMYCKRKGGIDRSSFSKKLWENLKIATKSVFIGFEVKKILY